MKIRKLWTRLKNVPIVRDSFITIKAEIMKKNREMNEIN
jgi:hypothetical protein